MKILVVDDNQTNVKLFRAVLRQKGHDVIEADDGLKGVEAAVREMPDLILMDIQMPVMDGLQAFERLKSGPETANIPVVALTSFAMKGDREKFLGLGFADYMSKPIDIDIFNEIVGRYEKNQLEQ